VNGRTVNRVAWLDNLLSPSFEREVRPLLERRDLPFILTVVVNAARIRSRSRRRRGRATG